MADGSIVTVVLNYNDADLVGIDETQLRLRKLNDDTGVFDISGANDVGVAVPTGVAGDQGVDVETNSAWWEVTSLGTYAVGIPLALQPAPEPEPEQPGLGTDPDPVPPAPDPEPQPEQPTPDDAGSGCAAGGGMCGAFGMITLPMTLMSLLGMRRRNRRRR